MTEGIVIQTGELHKMIVAMMSETIPTEFGKVREEISTLENRLDRLENTCVSYNNRTNETGRTDATCGGVIEEKEFGEIIYKEGKSYSNSENCMWTVVVPDAGMISFQLVTSGFEDSYDYITVNSVDQDGVTTGTPSKLK
ncbi:unnamed protein product [Orchesella dallaii]|uniref:CUB domain-containing protein n=1 Tax=Orchesella dallaii TaxID=48710 RepID=A0ABP1PQ81_9HEXA